MPWGAFVLLAVLALPFSFATPTPSVSVSPSQPLQGDAVMVQIDAPAAQVTTITNNGTPVPFFAYGTTTRALIGIALNATTGTSSVAVRLRSGDVLQKRFAVQTRARPAESLPIPAQMGGNSVSNQKAFVSKLSQENAILASLTTNSRTLWSKPFIAPVATPIITDPYGFSRDSGAAVIAHKGADFHAPVGTPVYAMDRGVVRLSRYSPVYGNTIVIDHGQGIMTMYMHLSERLVAQGALVEQGEAIARSGDTGYAEGPHLHVSVRINGQSIDPIEFLSLFGVIIAAHSY